MIHLEDICRTGDKEHSGRISHMDQNMISPFKEPDLQSDRSSSFNLVSFELQS